MHRPQRLLSDTQTLFTQDLGLLVLSLCPIKERQAMEHPSDREILLPQNLFKDAPCPLIQRFSLFVLTALAQIVCCFPQHFSQNLLIGDLTRSRRRTRQRRRKKT